MCSHDDDDMLQQLQQEEDMYFQQQQMEQEAHRDDEEFCGNCGRVIGFQTASGLCDDCEAQQVKKEIEEEDYLP